MLRGFFICFPVAVIVAACSSGVVDEWDPEAELKSRQEEKAFCADLINNPTHKIPRSHTGTLVGKKFYFSQSGFAECPDFFEIGKTYRNGSQKTKLVKQGDDIDIYVDYGVAGFDVIKETFKPIKWYLQ